MTSFYGYCPICHAPGMLRERRPNGNDICQNNHSYPSTTALEFVPVDFIPVTPVDLEYENDLLRNDLNVLQKELEFFKKATITLFYDGLLSPEQCKRIEELPEND